MRLRLPGERHHTMPLVREVLRGLTAALVLLALPPASRAAAAAGPASTPADAARALRARIDVDTWDDGGELSRFAYLHMSEIFPTAVVRRGGAVRALPLRPREAVGKIVVGDASDNFRTLDRFVTEELISEGGLIMIIKGGFGGQLLIVDTRRDIVIAVFGTNRAPAARPALLPHQLSEWVDAVFQGKQP